MILLTVIAVGLLTLSTISLRASSQGSAHAEARANAKLALMLAIGELQKQMGPDQRISANGAILTASAVANPHWAGVWNSWHAGTPDPAAPPSPDGTSAHQTIGTAATGMSPTYAAQRADHFRAWLVSLTPTQTAAINTAKNFQPTATKSPAKADEAVELVGEGSIGANRAADHVRAGLISFKANANATSPVKGRYGWWIGDESQKARVMEDSYNSDPPDNDAERIFRAQAPGSTGTSVVKGLENITDDKQLKALPTLQTLNLLDGATEKPAATPAENFHTITPYSRQVLADVREGGLKRDLSTLLERPIVNTAAETVDDFMLYRFNAPSAARQERVPIQDLAAYYQLYDSSRDPNLAKGIRYTSSPQNNQLTNGIQVAAPDYGDGNSPTKYTREYTSMYRSPVPVKVEFLVGMKAEPIQNPPPNGNTHRLILGFLPAVTLWNPNNVPITMNTGDPNFYSQMLRFPNLALALEWNLSNGYVSKPVSLAYAASALSDPDTGKAGASNKNEFIFDMYFSATNPIIFEPGEVRLFSYSGFNGNFSMDASGNQKFIAAQEAKSGWDPSGGFLPGRNSAWRKTNERTADPNFNLNGGKGFLAFKATDTISLKIKTEKESALPYALQNTARGAAMNFSMSQKSNAVQVGKPKWGATNYNLLTRTGSATDTLDFSDRLIRKGYPSQPFTTSISGSNLIAMNNSPNPSDKWKPLFKFALMAGCETNEASNGTSFAGRKFASRPFLHSSPIAPPYIDSDDNNSLYNYGWNWWLEDIGSIVEANIESNITNPAQGLYGGGYTLTNGTSHVVQQEIPVTPPISIAALSHAHLGGYSTASGDPSATNPWDYSVLSAVGYGGLFPHTLQAIGNSYAHPNLAADKAFTTWSRTFVTAASTSVTLADHSYLANKALWDEFFFSSITPQLSEIRIFGNSTSRTAKAVAQDFFFKITPTPLPNRRMVPYKYNLDSSKLDNLFVASQATQFTDGLADKIAAHLMVEGPFNVNSTSVEAWKVFLSSLKGKPVAYLDKGTALNGGVNLSQTTSSGIPIGPVSLPNGKPTSGSSNAPSNTDQWTNWRELNDTEIEELATAIVEQVKLRGPFLSLSEFVNRRLDSSNEDLSVKGALQAALDDPSVSINSGFRSDARRISKTEIQNMNPAFPKALEGPVAYGSAAYIDQADILRNFTEQLTPRGDTFVIRAYGDSLDASGKVQARAWCEANVQRVPSYIDKSDQPHTKRAALTSVTNKTYGRKFEIINFRWLAPLEI